MIEFLLFIAISYIQHLIIIGLLFAGFNAIMKTGFNKRALQFNSAEKKIIFTTPIAYIIIGFISTGFMATILSLLAFIAIYAYFTGYIKN